MATQEIQSTDWKEFCGRFERLHRGDQMTLYYITPAGHRQELVSGMPLQKVEFDPAGECSNRILLTFFRDGSREMAHEIIEPIHVKVREEDGGSKGLQIDAENGTTVVSFSSGRLDQLLEGLS